MATKRSGWTPTRPVPGCACRVCKGAILPPAPATLDAVPDELVDAFDTASMEAAHAYEGSSPIASESAYIRGGLAAALAVHEAMVRARVEAEILAEAAKERAEAERLEQGGRGDQLTAIGHHAKASHLEDAARIARGEQP